MSRVASRLLAARRGCNSSQSQQYRRILSGRCMRIRLKAICFAKAFVCIDEKIKSKHFYVWVYSCHSYQNFVPYFHVQILSVFSSVQIRVISSSLSMAVPKPQIPPNKICQNLLASYTLSYQRVGLHQRLFSLIRLTMLYPQCTNAKLIHIAT